MSQILAPLSSIGAVDQLAFAPAAVWWLLVTWLAAVGGCFGSFMNVVIYRLPAGLSVVHPGSRCPKCLHAIRARDNIPVIGWLLLRGRCRDCGNSISARYPAVEALVAFVTVSLALTNLFPGTHNLPVALKRLLEIEPWVLWLLFAGQLLTTCTLICAALIEFDGQKIPSRLFVLVAATGMGATFFLPTLLHIGDASPLADSSWARAGRLMLELAAAGVGTLLLFPLRNRTGSNWRESARPILLALGSVSIWMGWIAVLFVAVATAILALIVRGMARRKNWTRRAPLMCCLAVVVLVVLLSSRWLLRNVPAMLEHWGWAGLLATVSCLGASLVAGWWLFPTAPSLAALPRTSSDS